MGDPTIDGTREVLEESLDEIRRGVADLSVGELNARPAGGETNSIAVITAHALGATLSWLSLGLGAPLPPRDRDAEFRTIVDANFGELTEQAIARCLAVLDGSTWDPTRTGIPNWNPHLANEPRTAAYSVAHALAHRLNAGVDRAWRHRRRTFAREFGELDLAGAYLMSVTCGIFGGWPELDADNPETTSIVTSTCRHRAT